MSLDGSYHFECICDASEHLLRFVLDNDEHTIYTSMFMNQYRPWYRRIGTAFKYIFGAKCRYGHWDCWTLQKEDVGRLKGMIADYEAGFIKESPND